MNVDVALLVVIPIVWSLVGFVALCIIPYTRDCSGPRAMFNPRVIYRSGTLNVNWFGCAILTIVFNLLCPILSLSYWFYWLCTVHKSDLKRKDSTK